MRGMEKEKRHTGATTHSQLPSSWGRSEYKSRQPQSSGYRSLGNWIWGVIHGNYSSLLSMSWSRFLGKNSSSSVSRLYVAKCNRSVAQKYSSVLKDIHRWRNMTVTWYHWFCCVWLKQKNNKRQFNTATPVSTLQNCPYYAFKDGSCGKYSKKPITVVFRGMLLKGFRACKPSS